MVFILVFLRYNSWDIINKPLHIFRDIFNVLVHPQIEAWIFTVTFGSFLAASYWILKGFSNFKN
ncbi:DUF1361 domain-containing protein [Psychroserpens burtonensis]|uniref:DUF1361 domain-containing protein n=1 Tax=Psychroserpens burtonensis TaxID=49278 RepID=UPI00146BCFC1